MILLADLGATNARLCVTEDCNSYSLEANYSITDFDSIEVLCNRYLKDKNLDALEKAVIGVAAPVIGDSISFVNTDLHFSIKQLKKNLFPKGLSVVNDLALQAHALSNLDTNDLSYIGDRKVSSGPKILVSPGTGLGLAGIIGEEVVATEAGHINIPDKNFKPDFKMIVDRFISENKRVPTYEDFLSGKGITYFYSTLSGDLDSRLTSEEILLQRNDSFCQHTIDLLNFLLASYLRYVALVWGSYGGVFLSGSIINSLTLEDDYEGFRKVFEDSETMGKFLEQTPLAIVRLKDIGFAGGLRLAKQLKE